ncbi:RusA family crossover junction endodeoxyribonuclease [Komagataeibacter medellinensis]|nr:RusA family crossover junction endodeoxyribonuclease [Komagataeibacter medellinensis]
MGKGGELLLPAGTDMPCLDMEDQEAAGFTIVIPGIARGKGRPRFSNGRTYTDAKTRNAEAWIRQCAIEQVGHLYLECPLSVEMTIDVVVPKSWPKAKREAAQVGELRATGKPDLDNCFKMCDALNGIVWKDDAQIVEATISRRYADVPRTILKVTPL